MYPFPHNCNILPSAKWLSYQWGKECCSGFLCFLFFFLFVFFSLSAPLPSRVFLWRKNMTEIVLMIPQMSSFVCNITNSSLNVFTVVACALWDIQRTECRMKVKKEPQDIILSPFLRWKWKIIIHSLFLSTSIYKQGRLGKLVTVCEVLLHIIKIMN